jgi:hypothetical protein
VWEYRELLYFLALRDVKVRYKQTAIGAAWAVLQPLTVMLVFTFIFGRLANLSSEGAPYALFALAGLVPWTYFASYLQSASLSLSSNVSLVSKVYFPRLCLPTAAVLAGLVDVAVSLTVLVVVTLIYGSLGLTGSCHAGTDRNARGGLPGSGTVALGDQRAISRRASGSPVPAPSLALRIAGGVLQHLDRREPSLPLCTQSHGWSYRRIPLGVPRDGS